MSCVIHTSAICDLQVEEEKIELEYLLTKYYSKLSAEELLNCEMRLLQAINFQMLVFSPYRALSGYLQDMQGATGRPSDADVIEVRSAP